LRDRAPVTNTGTGTDVDVQAQAKAKADAAAAAAAPAPPANPYATPGGTFDTGDPGDLTHTSGRDFIYGRDPNYVTNTAAAERATSGANAATLNADAAAALGTGHQLGTAMSGYGQTQAAGSQDMATTLAERAGQTQSAGAALQNRQGATANYVPANAALGTAQGNATQLAGLEATQGPSGAQAQLQSGINASEASNLAMARSGRGWGGSASGLTQATNANASATQQAANSSAQLSATEDAAYRQREAANLSAAAGINTTAASQLGQQGLSQAQLQQQTTAENDSARAALNAQGLNAYGQAITANTQAGALGLQGMQAGAGTEQGGETLGMQGTQAAQSAYGQGEQMAGINESAQQAADLAREQDVQQQYGIQSGVAINNQNQTNSGWGTALSTAATVAGIAAMASDIHAKDNIAPLDASTVNAGRSAAAGRDAGPSASENAGRTAAAGMDSAAQAKADAADASALSMGVGAVKSAGAQLGQPADMGVYNQMAAMGRPTAAYGMQAPQWGQLQPGQITSDEDEKSGIHESAALDMVDEAPGYAYHYKDPERHGVGEHFGPMAQDLQKTPAGRSTVERTPDGTLAVNTGRLALVEHAAMHSMRKDNAEQFASLRAEIDALKNRKAG
jgi:hypothetical protein